MKKTFQLTILLLVVAIMLNACGAAPTAAPAATQVPPAATQVPAVATEAPATAVPPTATTAPAATVAPTQEKVTLTWFEHLSTEWGNEWFDKVTKAYEAKTGVHVERISAPWGDLWPKMTTWMQSNEMPDVYGTYAGWNATLDKNNALADLTPLIPQLNDPAKFVADQGVMWPGIGQFNGKLEMVPWWLQAYGLFYNKEEFDKRGYKVPTTWDELTKLLEQMKKDGVNGMEMTWGVPAEAGVHFGYLQWMWRALGAGGTLEDATGKPVFNSPEGKLAMQYWADLYTKGLVMQSSSAASVQQNRGDFCAAKTLMIIDGPWMGATCKSMKGTFTVVMAPGLCGEKSCGNVVYPWYFAVAENSKNKVEALKFIDYLTGDEVGSDFSKTFSISLANPIRYADADYKNDPITGKMQALLAAKGNAPLPPTMNAEEVQTMIGTEWQKVLFGQQTVDEAIVSIEKQWKEIIAK
jgi:ABC-type glycerol-3-phosphate transport system substrate-binding protein